MTDVDRDSLAAFFPATDPDRLMYGEDPNTCSASEAAHWINAYTELLEFKDRLLLDMESGIKNLSEPAGREIRNLDVGIIHIQRKRYRSRLAYWQGRRAELLSLERAHA